MSSSGTLLNVLSSFIGENERIITNGLPEEITIVNYNGNTPALLSRLLKYGELCELKSPKYIKEELKNIIDEALENYGV